VKELIQDELTADNLERELSNLLENEQRRAQLLNDYQLLRGILKSSGNASENAAHAIVQFIRDDS